MHPQGALEPTTTKKRRRRKKRAPDEPALSLRDGGRRRMRRRRWKGGRSLSLCGGEICRSRGLLWPPEEAPRTGRWELETPVELEAVEETEEDQKHHRVHCFHIRPLHKTAVSPGHPPP